MKNKQVIIAGAGIAGLVAARLLIREGIEVTILEARERTGGRILSEHSGDLTLEAGPEFIHGHLRETIALLKAYDIPYIKTSGKMYFLRNGRFTQEEEIVEHWDLLIKKMKQVKRDLPFIQFLNENFSGDVYQSLRSSAIRYAEGFDLADAQTVSTISLIREWELEATAPYRIPGGYGQLTDALRRDVVSSGGEILLNHEIQHVQWAKADVLVSVSGEQVFRSAKLLVALPAGVLSQKENGKYGISFLPEIPQKRSALEHIGFGAVVKILLQWKTPFWKSMIPDAQFILSGKEFPTWWTQHPDDFPLLTGWVGGPGADRLSLLTDEDLMQLALNNLSSMFEIPKTELEKNLTAAKIFNWRNEIFTRGAYSFTLAAFPNARADCKASVDDTLYFAGEACYDGPHGGTVEAAIISGIEAAREIIGSTT
jgi:monoamine oxidase